jgi:hypothetical protein
LTLHKPLMDREHEIVFAKRSVESEAVAFSEVQARMY